MLTSPFGPAREHLPKAKQHQHHLPAPSITPILWQPPVQAFQQLFPPPPAPASSSGALPSLLGVHFAILRVGCARFIMAGDRCRKHCSCPLAGITPTAAAKTTSPRASIGTLSLPNGSVSKTTCPMVSQNGSPWCLDGEHPGVRTSVADRLPLLVNQEQDEGQAEDAHDAGACCQCSGRDICNSRAPE